MINLSNKDAYVAKFREHVARSGAEDAAKLHIGGIQGYDLIGFVAAELLKKHVIGPASSLVDVGCGSGRVARYLADLPQLQYLGTDVVGEILEGAQARSGRPDWRFAEVDDLVVPVADESVDAVCFFSVLTHLLHEQSFAYLREAARAVRPGGRIAFSFLDFADPRHRRLFLELVKTRDARSVLTVYIDRPAIDFWIEALCLELELLLPNDRPMLEVTPAVTLDDGTRVEGEVRLGQSFCVLRKP